MIRTYYELKCETVQKGNTKSRYMRIRKPENFGTGRRMYPVRNMSGTSLAMLGLLTGMMPKHYRYRLHGTFQLRHTGTNNSSGV